MTRFFAIFLLLFFFQTTYSQKVQAENLSAKTKVYWDANKKFINSVGCYYIDDQHPITTEKHGKWLFYSLEGTLEEERYYFRDRIHGKQTLYFPDKKTKRQMFCVFNVPDSTFNEWNSDGKLIISGLFDMGHPVGDWKYFYDNGFIESEGLYENGEFDGKWIKYLDPEGIVIRLRYDKKIPQDSTPDLQLLKNRVWEIQNYKEGLIDGEFVNYAYYSIDKPKSITNYKKGKLDGISIRYYDNGIVYYSQNYTEGELDGYTRFYYSNGQLKEERKFLKGVKIGESKFYDENGELIKKPINKRP